MFQEIETEHKNNFKNIKALKYHTKLTYGYSIIIAIVILIEILIIITNK